MKIKRFVLGLITALFAVSFSSSAMAQGKTTVTSTNVQGWSMFTEDGGKINFVSDSTAPSGRGALQLTTNDNNEAVAQLGHQANTHLSDIKKLSYFTKQVSGYPGVANPFYYLGVCLNGADSCSDSFTYLVYEPYLNGTVLTGTWQQWNVYAGQFWSSDSYTNGACNVTAGPGGPASYSLSYLKASCPKAVVVEFGVGIGTSNPNYDVGTDLINFNGTAYDFETAVKPNAN